MGSCAATVMPRVIRKAAELYRDTGGGSDCPTIQELVSAKQIDGSKTDDPWNRPYKIACSEGDIHVTSGGNDKQDNTPDDIRDDMKPSDVQKLMEK